MQKARMEAVKENKKIKIRFDVSKKPGFYYFDTDNNRVILAFQDSAVSGDPGRALVWNSGITTTTNLTK
jgi:hypothetical protein